jgi:hypothetical protein
MLKYESFNLPNDGLTRVGRIGHWGNDLEAKGWSMVGLVESSTDEDGKTELWGVYRLTTDEALRVALERTAAAEKRADEAKSKADSLSTENDRQSKRIAELVEKVERVQRLETLVARARERFGAAFAELEQ